MNNVFSWFWLEYPLVSLWVVWVVFLFYFSLRRKSAYGIFFKNSSLISEIYRHNTLYHGMLLLLIAFILLMYSLLLWKPYLTDYSEREYREANDIIFVFDLSYSMIANDMRPSRLEAAKSMFLELSNTLENNRLWLVLYSWKAFQSVPLSFDTNFIRQSIENIRVESLPQMRFPELQGTAIGDWLLMWLQSLDLSDDTREKIIILMTDGEENRGVESRKVIPLLQKSGVKVYTIAFWKDEDALIELQNQFWIRERLKVGGIDESLLQEIAQETTWAYFRATDTETIGAIVTSLSALNTGVVEIESFYFRRPLFWEWILILIFLHIILWILFISKKFQY